MDTQFKIVTERIKDMIDTSYTLVSSKGKRVTVKTRDNGRGGYEYRVVGAPRLWTYPFYAIVWAIRHLNNDIASAAIRYKRKTQIGEILVTALYREGVLQHQYYLQYDEVLIVPFEA